MSIDVDKISLNDIFDGFEKQAENVDAKEIDNYYRTKYPKMLAQYEFVKQKDLIGVLEKGNVIKFSKKNIDEISCSCYVVLITYLDEDKRVIDKIVLQTNGGKRTWSIYPNNHYIFILNRHASKINSLVSNFERKTSLKLATIGTEPKLSKKELITIMKKEGKTDEYIENYFKMDNGVDNIISKHEKRVNSAHNKDYMKFQRKKMNPCELDYVVGDIFKHNPLKPKKKKKT